MDWIPKNHLHWDWEALLPFSGKEAEVSKLVQQPDWNDRPSINYGIGNESGGGACCSSEFGNGSPRSSISASTDSPSKASPLQAEVVTRKFNFEPVQQSPKDLKKNRDLTKGEATIFSEVAALDGHMEQLIGLKLGKRTYFEDVYGATSITNSSSLAAMNPLTGLGKKVKVPQQNGQSLCCQVEGCNLDLTSAKDYHRKHRVCETHSKSPMVIVAGQERRFCQQCSRFHGLSEFDQKKRSCRRRLSDHNARRRKPQSDTFSFSSSRFSASYFDERQPTTLNFGSASFNEVANMGCSTWNDSGGFKLIPTKESWINSNKSKGINRLHLPCIGLPNTASTVPYNSERLMLFKGAAAKFMDKDALVPGLGAPGLGAPVAAAYSDGASDLRRALSLLSNEYWAPPNVEHVSDIQFVNVNTIAAQSANHPTNVATGVWQQDELPLAKALPFSLQSNDGQFREYQMQKTSNLEATFFDSTQIH